MPAHKTGPARWERFRPHRRAGTCGSPPGGPGRTPHNPARTGAEMAGSVPAGCIRGAPAMPGGARPGTGTVVTDDETHVAVRLPEQPRRGGM